MSQKVKVVDIFLDDLFDISDGSVSESPEFIEKLSKATYLAQSILDEIDGHDLATINMALLMCKKIISQALQEKQSPADITPDTTVH